GIRLLARTEGIFTEPAGGTTVAVTKKLIEQGRIPRDESIVISVTGNGYKTLEAVLDTVEQPFRIPARLADFDELHARLNAARAAIPCSPRAPSSPGRPRRPPGRSPYPPRSS